jgi:hypothetical protein
VTDGLQSASEEAHPGEVTKTTARFRRGPLFGVAMTCLASVMIVSGCASSSVTQSRAPDSSPLMSSSSVGSGNAGPTSSVENAPASSGSPVLITDGSCAGLSVTAASPSPSSYPQLEVVAGTTNNFLPFAAAGGSIYLHATGPCVDQLMIIPDGKLLLGPIPDKPSYPDAHGDAVVTSLPSGAGLGTIALRLGSPCATVCNGQAPLLAVIEVTVPAASGLPPASASPDSSLGSVPAPSSMSAPTCTPSRLGVTYKQTPDGTTMWSTDVTLTNNGNETCSLDGFPDLLVRLPSGKTQHSGFTPSTTAPFPPIDDVRRYAIPVSAVDVIPGASVYVYVVSNAAGIGQSDCALASTNLTLDLPGASGPGPTVQDITLPGPCGGSGFVSPITTLDPSS